MIAFILAGASFLTAAMGFTGIPRALAAGIAALDLSVPALLLALTIFYVVLGCFLDGISIVVLTTGIIQPMIIAAGIDVIWYGIYLVIVVEIAQITPPVGFNLFVLQYFTGRDILYVARAALPFFCVLLASIVVLVMVSGIATFLPTQMLAR
jgi:TRAP-type C4-dicarboxylate transport system permease large subunit